MSSYQQDCGEHYHFLNLAPLIIFCQAYAVEHQLREVIFLKHDNQS